MTRFGLHIRNLLIMTNKNEDGLLDDLGHSQRFVNPYGLEDSKHSLQNKYEKKNEIKKSNRINNKIKYGNNKDNFKIKDELTTGDLIRIASGFQQAIVKVTSYGKGTNKILNHLAYISRNFDLPIEDQDRSLLTKREEVIDLLSSWNSIYFDNRKNGRDTVHMVFSAPPGTSRDVFKQLTKEFLNDEYGGAHDYLFVPHNDTEHPHIHSVICLRSVEGKKLDPRKEYLNQLRKRFAEKCREQGIYVEASRRFERGLSGKSVKSEFVQMRGKRQEIPIVDKQLVENVKKEIASNQTVDTGEKIRRTRNESIKNQFYQAAKSLYNNYVSSSEGEQKDSTIKAAKLLLDYSKKFPTELTRSDFLKEKLIVKQSLSLNSTNDFLGIQSLTSNKTEPKKDIGLGED